MQPQSNSEDAKTSARQMTPEEAYQLYRWLAIPRVLVTLVSAAAVLVFWRLDALYFDPRPVVFGLVPAFVVLSAVTAYLAPRPRWARHMLRMQLVLDGIGATVAILLTGGPQSPFALLYILVLISASLVSFRGMVAFGITACVAYVAMYVAQHVGVSAPRLLDPAAIATQETMTVAMFVCSILLVAFQSSFYFARIRAKEEETVRLKDEFLFRTIHDLRSPSTVIRLVFDGYKERAGAAVTPQQATEFAAVESALRRMSGLIEDLLKTAQGDSPQFVMLQEPVDVRAVVGEVAAELAPLMAKRGIVFRHDAPGDLPPVIGDAEKLKEVFSNFLDNAIKYNVDGGGITVTYATAPGAIVASVSDTGIGISEKILARLFSPYFRGDVGNEIVGTGLGMFMTRKLVQKMRGDVSVTSEKGRGTTFSVRLPTVAG